MSSPVLEPASNPLTIVAIGASAGGLDPLKEFFRAVRPAADVSYVVITHLPAHHTSHLAELLGRVAQLPVGEAENGQAIDPGRVYVLPPGTLMGVRQGAFSLGAPGVPGRPPKPIDFFMTALADDAQERCIGVVLSGTDHDGTAGLKSIRNAGGLAIVQNPETAQFPGMPNSAISGGAADLELSPEEMPEAIGSYLSHSSVPLPIVPADGAADPPVALTADVFHDLLAIVEARTGSDFRWYRQGMLRRRIRRRMSLHGLDRLEDYRAMLDDVPAEVEALKGEFLIGVTEFFRDPEAWGVVENDVLPALLAEHAHDDSPIRVWTPGCATGEESYSIAMLLLEQRDAASRPIQVFASDLDEEALAVARKGSYHESIAAAVSSERLGRFFEHRRDRYVVRNELREAVLFAPHNLVSDTPFSKLDLVVCRNVLIYLEPVLQQRVLDVFHFALRPRGFLLLGRAESLGKQAALFEPASRAIRLFRRVGERTHLPSGFGGLVGSAWGSDRRRSRRADALEIAPAEFLRKHLGERPVAAAVLVDRDGHALHFDGEIDRYLHLSGDASWDLSRLMRPDLRRPVRLVLRQALSQSRAVQYRAVFSQQDQSVEVLLRAEPAALHGRSLAVVMFIDPARGASNYTEETQAVPDSGHELALALEDAERSYEDLRVAHEEAVLLNEELQSSNEELESSKEELQSLNEELTTVNAELEERIVEVRRGKDDLANLLRGTRIAAILLDRELRVAFFTPSAGDIFRLKAGDEGRLLSDITARVRDPAFHTDVETVLRTGSSLDAELTVAEGRIYLRRIQPYVSSSPGPQGIVVTYVDVTSMRDAAQQARHLVAVLEDSNDAVIAQDLEGKILGWNRGAEMLYGYVDSEAVGSPMLMLVPPADKDEARRLLRQVAAEGRSGPDNARRCTRTGELLTVSVTMSALRDASGNVFGVVSTERDLTHTLSIEREMHFRRLADRIPALLRVDDASGHAQFVNSAYAEFTGQDREQLLGHGWVRFMHPEDKQDYLSRAAQALAGRHRFEADFRLLRSDGVYRWMRHAGAPFFDFDDKFAGYAGIAADAEERKRAESALLVADRRKDQYLAMLAHELRKPLAPIRNAVSVVLRSGALAPNISWAMGIVDRQTEALSKILDDLLDVARVASGKVTLAVAPVELKVVVDRAVETMRPVIESRRQHLSIDQPADDLLVEGDLMRLIQVLSNLLSNASKYSDEGGRIAIGVAREGSDAVVRVTDDGAGMAAEFIPRAFDLFAQADGTLDRAKGGLGLGLTLAYQIVQLHRGRLDASSPGLGRGSEFTVRLPLCTSARAVQSKPLSETNEESTANFRVLVVDDNSDAAESLAVLLRMEGHDVTMASDGATALRMAELDAPDAVILDIGLPGVDGYEVARILRGRSGTAGINLIAVSGYGQPEDVTRARDAGFDHHFVKPVDLNRLLAVLKRPQAS